MHVILFAEQEAVEPEKGRLENTQLPGKAEVKEKVSAPEDRKAVELEKRAPENTQLPGKSEIKEKVPAPEDRKAVELEKGAPENTQLSGKSEIKEKVPAPEDRKAAELEKRYPETNQIQSKAVVIGKDGVKVRKERRQLSTSETRRLTQINCEEAGRTVKLLEDEPYYHGFMTREDAEKILKRDVRKTDVAGRHHFVISVMHKQTVKHFLIKRTVKKRLFWVHRFAFKTISDLVQYHLRNSEPLCDDDVSIQKPCLKQGWQLNPEQIEPHEKIGEGAFGEVYKGLLQDGMWGARIPVAIKTLHSTQMTASDRIQFLQEANIMREFKHENVIRLLGVCTSKEPIMIVMELASGGSLLSRLKDFKNPPLTANKVNYVFGAARGMAYLQSKEIIHR
ncbi:unnamed protein product [Angiostrongylus costaricensis]|uniref:Tyrosine-protein kinase n=1 Tax=Angiostrongylus costaricensis TaxID=334426 RepID=A0A0R3PPS6_ANGCS|nr:unnamed protein product [Angiostrongylus costaricensis]